MYCVYVIENEKSSLTIKIRERSEFQSSTDIYTQEHTTKALEGIPDDKSLKRGAGCASSAPEDPLA